MSRIGKKLINIPESVEINYTDNILQCKGPKGELNRQLHKDMKIEISEGVIKVNRPSESQLHRSLHGLTRTLVANMIEGVSQGFTKKLEVVGIGYKAEMKGKKLLLNVGIPIPFLWIFLNQLKLAVPHRMR